MEKTTIYPDNVTLLACDLVAVKLVLHLGRQVHPHCVEDVLVRLVFVNLLGVLVERKETLIVLFKDTWVCLVQKSAGIEEFLWIGDVDDNLRNASNFKKLDGNLLGLGDTTWNRDVEGVLESAGFVLLVTKNLVSIDMSNGLDWMCVIGVVKDKLGKGFTCDAVNLGQRRFGLVYE